MRSITPLVVLYLVSVAYGSRFPEVNINIAGSESVQEDIPKHDSHTSASLKSLIKQGYQDWESYKKKYGKTFYDEKTESKHLLAFLRSQQLIQKHNKKFERGDVTFKLGMTNIADLPFSKYRKLNGYQRRLSGEAGANRNSSRFVAPLNTVIPDSVDWRDHGFVTEVKNQGDCASCWAFSSTGALEGQHKRATGKLVSLSEQNLVDCSYKYDNGGCLGGYMSGAFQYIKDNNGVDTEASYPYMAKDGDCHFKNDTVGAVDTGYTFMPEGDEEALRVAVATQGPISVAIDATKKSFQLYKSGVYYEKDCSTIGLTHAMLVVGYGKDSQYGDYWIVKNSWDTDWGEEGYIRMSRNRSNNCGIATYALYPLV